MRTKGPKMGPTKTIRVTVQTHDRINDHGQRGETFEQILKRIMDKYEKFKDVENDR